MKIFSATKNNDASQVKEFNLAESHIFSGDFFTRSLNGEFIKISESCLTESDWIDIARELQVYNGEYLSEGDKQKLSLSISVLCKGYKDNIFIEMLKSGEYSVALEVFRRDALLVQRFVSWFLLRNSIKLTPEELSIKKDDSSFSFFIDLNLRKEHSVDDLSLMYGDMWHSIGRQDSKTPSMFVAKLGVTNDGQFLQVSPVSREDSLLLDPLKQHSDIFVKYDEMLLPTASPFGRNSMLNHVLAMMTRQGLMNDFEN